MTTNPMSDWSQLRKTLSRRREAMGLRQSDVAERGGFGLRSLERWEGGDAEPHALNLFLWCSVLGVRLTPVMTNTLAAGLQEPTPPVSGRVLAPEGA
nr:helix-turn-helix transcriptional regulator [uncultured Azospirillum sp.]